MSGQLTQPDGTLALPPRAVGASASVTYPERAPWLPRLSPPLAALRLPRLRALSSPRAGTLSLLTLLAGAFLVMVFATSHSSPLVPGSQQSFPTWEAGPLHSLFGHLSVNGTALNLGFSAVLLAMAAAYGVALASVRFMSMRAIVGCAVALHVVLLMSPPLPLTDLFNYLGYARLDAVHHLNPYVNGIGTALHDPVYRFTSWHHLRSPYGPLFTAITLPVALLPISVAYWVLKLAAVTMSLVFLALVARCARLLGRDPRYAVLFVVANPIYLLYAVGGFHNDFFMLVPSTAAIVLLLEHRDRGAGMALMLAAAVKFTAIMLLPFLLLAALPARRRVRMLSAAALTAVPLVAGSLLLFGAHLPNLRDQSTLLTDFSFPNLVGLLIGAGGGAPWLLRVANVALVLAVALLVRRRRGWLAGAGWGTLALLLSLAWLVPWYVIWLLPLAALADSPRLRRAALAFTAFLVLAFMPAMGMLMHTTRINLMSGSAGQASKVLQHKLEQ